MSDTTATPASAEHAAEGEHDEHVHGAHEHDEIHLPPNSWSPISMAFAITCTMVGFVTSPLGPFLWIIGLLWTIGSGIAWFRGARSEYLELPD